MERPVYLSHADVSVLDVIDAPVWIFNIERHGIWWANRAAIQFWRAESLEEIIARDFSSDSPTVRNRLRSIIENAAPGGAIHENWTLYPRGVSISVPLTLTPIHVGEDKHDAVLIEAAPFTAGALAATDRRLVEATRYTDIMISYVTSTGEILSMNPSAMEAFSRPDVASTGLNFGQRFINPPQADDMLQRCEAGEESSHEVQVITTKGVRWHRVSLRLARDPMTGENSFVVIEEDVSDLKQAVIDLEALNQNLEAANRAKSEFLSSMSHELRTPMNSILGFAQLLEDDPTDPISDRHMRYGRQILDNGGHLLALIDQVLDLSRIEAGKLKTVTTDIPAGLMVSECVAMSKTLAADQNTSITIDVSDALVCQADALQLRQVLLNLLSNAIKFNHDGGTVHIHAERQSRFVRITVTDSGIGISNDKLPDVFDPFNRLGFETSAIQGSGIGLSIAKRLIDVMDGNIGVTSELGVGSAFWIELPVSDSNPST